MGGGQGSVPGVPIGSQPGLGAGIGSQPGLGAGIGSQPGPGVSASGFGTVGEIGTRLYKVNGVMTFDNHACVFQNGGVSITGPRLAFGETEPYEIETGFAVIETGERVQINDGLVHIAVVSISNQQRIVSILAGAGMTYNDFIERTGTIPPQQGMFEVTAGVITIDGVYRNINTGLMVVVDVSEVATGNTGNTGSRTGSQTGFGGQPGLGAATGGQTGLGATGGRTGFGGATGSQTGFEDEAATVTIVVTETAAHETQTVSRPVTVTKTATRDIYTTVTRPVFNSIAVDSTKFVKETVTVREEQVIRSPLPGSVIVSTVPKQTQIVITVTDTATQFFVETTLDTITHTLNHFEPNFNFATVTVLNPETTTVQNTISQTSVTTVFATSTAFRTRYETSTSVVTVAAPVVTGGYY